MLVLDPHGPRAADLADARLILHNTQSRLRLRMEERFLDARLRRNEIAAAPYTSVACLLAEVGLGVTLVDSFSAIAGRRYRLDTRPLEPAVPVPVCMVSRAHETPARVPGSFMAELRGGARTIVEQGHGRSDHPVVAP